MRPHLIKSFLVVVSFWFLATLFLWSAQIPQDIGITIAHLSKFYHFFGVNLHIPEQHNFSNTLATQALVFKYWSLPLLSLGAISFLAGILIVAAWGRATLQARTARYASNGSWRGIVCTVGLLPQPRSYRAEPIELGDDPKLEKLSLLQRQCLSEMLGVAIAHPNTYPGEGISTPWINHIQNLLNTSLQQARHPDIHALVTIGHELGKITSYSQDPSTPNSWLPIASKHPDQEAALIVSTLPGWFNMPYETRQIVLLAIKYYTRPTEMPILDSNQSIYKTAIDCVYRGTENITSPIIQQEKNQTLQNNTDLHDLVFDAFLAMLPSLPFQNKGLPKGVQAAAWKFDSRVYLIEIKLREDLLKKLPPDVAGALAVNSNDRPAERVRIQPLTAQLLRALHLRGWLVTVVDDMTVKNEEALWNIQAGTLAFKGIIIIEVPPEYRNQLPSSNSIYDVKVLSPLYNNRGVANSVPQRTTPPAPSPTPTPAPTPTPSSTPTAPPPPEQHASFEPSMSLNDLSDTGLLQPPRNPPREQPQNQQNLRQNQPTPQPQPQKRPDIPLETSVPTSDLNDLISNPTPTRRPDTRSDSRSDYRPDARPDQRSDTNPQDSRFTPKPKPFSPRAPR